MHSLSRFCLDLNRLTENQKKKLYFVEPIVIFQKHVPIYTLRFCQLCDSKYAHQPTFNHQT